MKTQSCWNRNQSKQVIILDVVNNTQKIWASSRVNHIMILLYQTRDEKEKKLTALMATTMPLFINSLSLKSVSKVIFPISDLKSIRIWKHLKNHRENIEYSSDCQWLIIP